MKRAGDVRHDATGEPKARTIVLRDESQLGAAARIARHLENFFAAIRRRIPERMNVFFLRLVQPKVLVTLGVIIIALFAVGLHYYYKLAREIDERLASNFFDDSIGIFTSPFKLSVGDRLSLEELTNYLRMAGYQQRDYTDSTACNDVRGSFAIQGSAVDLTPSREASITFNLIPVRIQINGNGRIASISSLKSGAALGSTQIEGELLATVSDGDRQKRITVAFSDIPETLRNAILAVEDRRFFSHNGIDWRGILRALWTDVNEGGIVQGGSTITQQLIKNAFLSNERTFARKLKEAAMAVILESRLSKEEIFALYSNNVYMGQSGTYAIHGFAEAAEVYFNKSLDKLTLGECAFLAGLVHAPNRYALSSDMTRAIERRNEALDAMVGMQAITQEQADAAKREPLQFKRREPKSDYGASYFVDYVQRFIEDRYGEQGLSSRKRFNTTMDPRLQRAAYEAVTKRVKNLDKILGQTNKRDGASSRVQAALVALDAHTGEVLAMIGGRDYNESQLNRATDAKRQPGSTFKPFVYATAISQRSYTAATLLSDTPQTFTFDGGRAEYRPTNYHGGFSYRDVTLREALARSLNVPTVELAMRVGLGQIANLAEEAGLERPRVYPSMPLGTSEVTPLELAGAYTAFANDGTALRPIPIKSIQGAERGNALQKVAATTVRVFSPQVAYLMTNLMQSVVDAGTASRLRAMGVKGAIAGKTGTSNDGWFAGYTPNIVCVVWVGFDDNTDLRLKASDVALPIWAEFMKDALDIHPEFGGDSFPRPGGIVTAEIDPTTGLLASSECPAHQQEIFISGTEPFAICSHYDTTDESLMAGLDDGYSMSASTPGYNRITLDVCAETGLLASPTCARVVRRTFEPGHEPMRVCWGEGRDANDDWRADSRAVIESYGGARQWSRDSQRREVKRTRNGTVY
ncbi:MAG TPA: PBP1A family penicillin-binding protein [Blastocatellia bacterium]|nr:PBP1A family penicillin-binding protein [Blastocatellia bacterium]